MLGKFGLGLVIWLVLGTGIVTAEGRLTVVLQPNLDLNTSVTSITKAELFRIKNIAEGTTYRLANISGGEAQFNLSHNDRGYFLIRINNLSPYILTYIDDPTKNINQSVGQELQISVIGNLLDPDYLTKCYKTRILIQWFNGGLIDIGDICIILSFKNSTLKVNVVSLEGGVISTPIDLSSIKPAHPNISKASFPRWVFNHGYAYDGQDSRCNTCHGNLDSKPEDIDSVTIDNGFCFGCHFGKEGIKEGFYSTWFHPVPTEPIPIQPTPTSLPKTPATPRAVPGFEVAVTVAALLILKLLMWRKS